MTLDRRQFLRLAALAAAASATTVACDSRAQDDPLAHPALLDALGRRRMRAIGRRWLAMHPAERDARTLRDALGVTRAADVEARVSDDFANGRTVVVDGWVLAATEARQCALLALTGD